MPHRVQEHTRLLKQLARQAGFHYCGISQAGFLEEEAPRLEKWLKSGHQGTMSYLENHFDKRLDPRLLGPGAKSVVTLLYNYHSPLKTAHPDSPKIASYAYGRDYHKVVKKKLQQLMKALETEVGQVEGRAFVDSAPVLERAWAARSGAGWIGKHGLLINKGSGSWYFLAELIIDLELEPDGPVKDHCGTCTACIDACPTEAIQPYWLEAEKCISYLTIELKDRIPEEFQGNMQNWAFGCDICQEVCPWNRFATKHEEPGFEPSGEFLSWTREDWKRIDRDIFDKTFAGTPLKRAGYEKLVQVIDFLDQGKPV